MSVADEIQAAIEKLTALKSRSSDGSWRFRESTGVAAITNEVGRGVAHHVPAPDAELIVTLHATIDAQVALLERAKWNMPGVPEVLLRGNEFLALARAINGVIA